MSRKLADFFLLAALIASPAFADASHNIPLATATSAVQPSVTLADVKTELVRAQHAGEIAFSRNQYPALQREQHQTHVM
jgi:hypothetical protein